MSPPTSSKCFFTCACVRARLCVRQRARVHKHTHPHRHARVLCVNSLRSRLFICEKTGAINPPVDFGRSPARGPGEGSALLGGGCSWCSKRDALRPSWTLPALGVCPSLGGQGRCYAARSNLGFKKGLRCVALAPRGALEKRPGGGEPACFSRIHQALEEAECAMFEDAKIITVLGTVLCSGGSQTTRGKQHMLLISHRKLTAPPAKVR